MQVRTAFKSLFNHFIASCIIPDVVTFIIFILLITPISSTELCKECEIEYYQCKVKVIENYEKNTKLSNMEKIINEKNCDCLESYLHCENENKCQNDNNLKISFFFNVI